MPLQKQHTKRCIICSISYAVWEHRSTFFFFSSCTCCPWNANAASLVKLTKSKAVGEFRSSAGPRCTLVNLAGASKNSPLPTVRPCPLEGVRSLPPHQSQHNRPRTRSLSASAKSHGCSLLPLQKIIWHTSRSAADRAPTRPAPREERKPSLEGRGAEKRSAWHCYTIPTHRLRFLKALVFLVGC